MENSQTKKGRLNERVVRVKMDENASKEQKKRQMTDDTIEKDKL